MATNVRTYVQYVTCVCVYMYVMQNLIAFLIHIQGAPSSSHDDSLSVSDLFKEPITITNAYAILFTKLGEILDNCNLLTLKGALFIQVDTPGGVELGNRLEEQIDRAESNSQLFYALKRSHCCNWLDTRLIEVLAYSSQSSNAVELIDAYKKLLFPRKLLDVLSNISEDAEAKEKYMAAVHAKTKMDPDKITVEDYLGYRWKAKNVIFDLGKGVLNIEHVEKGCLQICYHVPIKCSFAAYKMAVYNHHKLYTINIMHIEIVGHPLIYDPWLSDLGKYSVIENMNAQQRG